MGTPTDSWGWHSGDQITPELTALRLLGGGSAYEAYLAFDEVTYAPVVVKFVRPAQVLREGTLRGLRREVETLEAVRLGVYDFIEKPFTRERLMQSVRNCLEHASLKRELSVLHTRIQEENSILGASPEVVRLRERIERVASANARVLIRGESGTGKELAANMLHRLSSRRDRALVKIN